MNQRFPDRGKKSTILIIVIVFLVSLVAGYVSPVQIMELKIRDFMFELRGPVDVAHSDIVIVEMNQMSDDEIPFKYPWPTNLYGKMIENLNRAGVTAIGIDVIFDQRDIYDLRNDTLFAQSLAAYENVVLAGRSNLENRVTSDGTDQTLSRVVYPNAVLRQSNPNPTGMVNMVKDLDDFIRSYPLYQVVMGDIHYSLGLEVIRILTDMDQTEFTSEGKIWSWGPFEVPLFQQNTFLINYYGGERTFTYIGFDEIIDDSNFDTVTEQEAFEVNLFDDPEYGVLQRGILQDKIVLVGATMPELQEIHPVPMTNEQGNTQMPGVEVHAHALQTLLDQNFLYTVSSGLHISIILLITCLIVILARYLPFVGGITAMLAMLGCWAAFSVYMFISHHMIFFYLSPVFAILTGYGGVTAYQYAVEEREKNRIKTMFSSYVSPNLVDRMIRSEEPWQLGGKETELTALFTDIINFTSISEKLSAPQVLRLMNEYLDVIAGIVMDEEGTLDKFIGDAVMAFYGAPAEVPQHAVNACRSAIRMQEAMSRLRGQWQSGDTDYPSEVLNMRMRIGINTGIMTVGNMGSSQRFNYTIIGDQVNIASRCESICKEYGVETIVTEHTRQMTLENESEFLFRFLDNIRFHGRHEPVRIYELIGYKENQSDELLSMLAQYDKALNEFREKRWNEAFQLFSEVVTEEKKLMRVSDDKVTPGRIYLNRSEEFKENPPSATWDPVFDQVSE